MKTTRPPESTTTRSASLRMTCRFCSTSRIGTVLAASASAIATSSTIFGARPFVGSSTSSRRFSFTSARGEGDHLLLAAREGAGALGAASVDVGEQPLDELAARALVALCEPQVLGDGERAEDLAILGHVADAALHDAVRGQPVDAIAAEANLARSGR